VPELRILLEELEHFDPGHARHLDVEQDDVKTLAAEQLERFRTAARTRRLAALALQTADEHFPVHALVVDDQHFPARQRRTTRGARHRDGVIPVFGGVQPDVESARPRPGQKVARGGADQLKIIAIIVQARSGRLAESQFAKTQHAADAGPGGIGERPVLPSRLRGRGDDGFVAEHGREVQPAFAHGAEAHAQIGVAFLLRDLDEHLAQTDDLIERRAQIVQQPGEPLFLFGCLEGDVVHSSSRLSILPSRRTKSTGLVS